MWLLWGGGGGVKRHTCENSYKSALQSVSSSNYSVEPTFDHLHQQICFCIHIYIYMFIHVYVPIYTHIHVGRHLTAP